MTIIDKGPSLRCQIASSADEVLACQKLRHQCFWGAAGIDQDCFDAKSEHLMLVDNAGELQGTLRYRIVDAKADWHGTYSGARYDIDPLPQRAIEIGRFCAKDCAQQAQVLRVAMAHLTRLVDEQEVKFLVGCASFAGIDPAPYRKVLKLLNSDHLLANPFKVGKKHNRLNTLDLEGEVGDQLQLPIPMLLKSYLALGGRVSDHAVVDHELNTFHVLVVVDVDDIPPARAKALRALAAI